MDVLPPLPVGHRVLHLASIASTNAEAMRLALTGEATGLWVIADHQTAGRGRAGRAWETISGNLMASVVVRLHEPPFQAPQLALVAGISLHEAIVKGLALRDSNTLKLKWPNDLLISGQKVGGILVESAGSGGSAGRVAVIGFGLNLAGHPELPGRPVTHLAAHGASMTPAEVLAFLAVSVHEWLARWDEGRGFDKIRTAWLQRSIGTGSAISINTGSGPIAGRFAGLDETGALLLEAPDGRVTAYTFGDVSVSV